jgi:hypothetical protein
MSKVTIGTTVINFPSSGTDANWAIAVDLFATEVANQLASIASPFDVSPRVEILIDDPNTNLVVPGCLFPHTSVRSFSLNYAIYRTNGTGLGTTSLAEEGTVSGVYNNSTSLWYLEHQFSGDRQPTTGAAYHTFDMSGDELTLSTVAIGGSYDSVNSKLSYSAKTVLISNL